MDENKAKKIRNITIDSYTSLLKALKKMDEQKIKLLIVYENNRFKSLVSIGDIQRAIINNKDLNKDVAGVLRKNIKVAHKDEDWQSIKKRMLNYRTECMPILDDKGELTDVAFWDEVFPQGQKRIERNLNLPVVIMAGGKGTRLKPITNVLPKPLIPIGDKSILEQIMDRFIEVGCNDFYMTLNYKADFIKQYFNLPDKKDVARKIQYIEEEIFLGTAGSLSLLKNSLNSTFFVSNCDILIDQDYGEILDYHREQNNELTIVAALKHYNIPYGILETGDNGMLKTITEKPEYTFQINSGMYVLEPSLLEEIPENTFFHITDLMNKVLERNGKVGVFPVSEKSWKDIGNWEEYLQEIDLVK